MQTQRHWQSNDKEPIASAYMVFFLVFRVFSSSIKCKAREDYVKVEYENTKSFISASLKKCGNIKIE